MDGKIDGPGKCEFLVIEASKDQGAGRPSAKSSHDYDKVARHCSDMARALEKNAGSQFLTKPNVQVIGILTSGSSLCMYGLSHKGYLSFFYPLGPRYDIPCGKSGIPTLLRILKQVVGLRLHLENMVEMFHNYGDAHDDDGTVIPNLPTPKKADSAQKKK